MNRSMLLAYQLLTGISDTSTGALLMIAPKLVLELLRLQAPSGQTVYLSLVGTFVLAVGISNLYGAFVIFCGGSRRDLEMVWLLTAFTRSSVAIFVFQQVMASTLASGWLLVAIFDGMCVMIQAVGLRRGWLAHAAR